MPHSGLGAGIAVSKLMKGLPGELWVVGTPAEEGHGPSASAKRKMAEAGFFKGVDAVMMMHPNGNNDDKGQPDVPSHHLAP